MQPYSAVKPHDPNRCPDCAPTGHGHQACQADDCGQIATSQTRRHATDAEYAAIPPGLAPLDGVAHIAVYGCDDCSESPTFHHFCTHPASEPVPCPKCKAVGDQPCTAKNGDPRYAPHTMRALAQPEPTTCTHAHRPDCDIFTDCQCTTDDPAPARAKRPSGQQYWPEMSGLRIPVARAQALLADSGIPWHQVAAVRSKVTQIGNQPAIEADVYQAGAAGDRIYDGHGRAVTETVEIPLPPTAPGRVA